MNTRHNCPECKERTFVRYIDTETNKHLADHVGRCNRESSCGYHYSPKHYFQDNNISFGTSQPKPYITPKAIAIQTKPVSFIPVEIFKQSLKNYEENNFVKYLFSLFGEEITNQLISKYFIGTSKYWDGATVFWQIDISDKIKTGKIMLYDATTGKRIKEPFNHINWVHSVLKLSEFNLQQCFFGEHLLAVDPFKPVAIVESEKTAVIASIYLPQFIWLAVGSLTNLNAEKCSVLRDKKVVLFPDLNCFDKWNSKAKELSTFAQFIVSDLLEFKATEVEKQQGLDLADYLVKFNYKEFQQQKQPEQHQKEFEHPQKEKFVQVQVLPPIEETNFIKKPDPAQQDNWEQDLSELEQYFKAITFPTQPINLDVCTKILNVWNFIEGHLAFVKANNGKQSFLPYLNRLQELKKYLTFNQN